ncbi:MAG: hypothetical protein HAW59_05205 [Betaproteobacteria bacterium]|nr:hypothetical protein [Betaproteobacteria bacterium]
MKPEVQKYYNLLEDKFGKLKKMGKGYSLYHVPSADILVYFRYSKIHNPTKNPYAFYGLDFEDIRLIKNSALQSFLLFITSDSKKDIFIPFNRYASYFAASTPSGSNQHHVNYHFRKTGDIINFSNIGKFSVEKYRDFNTVLDFSTVSFVMPELSHGEIQSLAGAIGVKLGYDVFFPKNDYNDIDGRIIDKNIIKDLPFLGGDIDRIIREIDVIWMRDNKLESFYEVEHSTPIYSGLLRFNDALLSIAYTDNFNIVAEDERENKFGLEINRPTFVKSKLIKKTAFVSYESLCRQYYNLIGQYYKGKGA